MKKRVARAYMYSVVNLFIACCIALKFINCVSLDSQAFLTLCTKQNQILQGDTDTHAWGDFVKAKNANEPEDTIDKGQYNK